jgi:hypothetical protein
MDEGPPPLKYPTIATENNDIEKRLWSPTCQMCANIGLLPSEYSAPALDFRERLARRADLIIPFPILIDMSHLLDRNKARAMPICYAR